MPASRGRSNGEDGSGMTHTEPEHRDVVPRSEVKAGYYTSGPEENGVQVPSWV